MANPLLDNQGGPGAELPYLLPQVNADGNGISGLLHPEIIAPLATYTGWNFYHPEKGDADKVVTNAGSYIPFPWISKAGNWLMIRGRLLLSATQISRIS